MKGIKADLASQKSSAKEYNYAPAKGLKLNLTDGTHASPVKSMPLPKEDTKAMNQPHSSKGYDKEAWNYKY